MRYKMQTTLFIVSSIRGGAAFSRPLIKDPIFETFTHSAVMFCRVHIEMEEEASDLL